MFDDPTGQFQILSVEYTRIYDVFERSGHTTEQLVPRDRTFFLAYMTDSSINSDGVYSLWFNNHGLLDTTQVPAAFREIGAPKSALIIERFVKLAENTPCPKDIEERSSMMELLSGDWPDSDELDQGYYGSGEDIDKLLITYLKKETEPSG